MSIIVILVTEHHCDGEKMVKYHPVLLTFDEVINETLTLT
jgi:hypothetical protein